MKIAAPDATSRLKFDDNREGARRLVMKLIGDMSKGMLVGGIGGCRGSYQFVPPLNSRLSRALIWSLGTGSR
jgi:hypothetical protein